MSHKEKRKDTHTHTDSLSLWQGAKTRTLKCMHESGDLRVGRMNGGR